MSHHYSGNGPSSASFQDSPSPRAGGFRRPSYATVAAGAGINSSQRGGDIEHPPTASTSDTSTREPSTYPSRSMEIDSGAYGGGAAGRRPGTSGATSANWASDILRYAATDEPHHLQPFFTPSYLRQSRYVQQLRQAYDDHQAELQERTHHRALNTNANASLSASSSSVNLNKLPPTHVHRGVSQDIVERSPTVSTPLHGGLSDDEHLLPLPSRWNEEDKWNGLEIMADGSEVRFNGVTKTSDEAAAVRSDFPMPKGCGLFYFEVTILSRSKDGLIGIGFSSRKANLNRLPGWEVESWAYHGDDGYVFPCTANGKAYGPHFAAQDVIGCGVNFRTGNAFFTKNGNYLGTAFTGIKVDKLYPSVGMKKPSEHLRVNFGKTPFVFDIDRMMEQERLAVLSDISKTDVSGLHPPDNENALIHNLISQYLAHEGYVETAKGFARDVHDREQSLSSQPRPFVAGNEDDDVHAINRQKIRKSILDGDIDRALKFTSSYYPHVLKEERNRDIYFRLRCRKFIEMMRRYIQLVEAGSSSPSLVKSVDSLGHNGHVEEYSDALDQQDTQMELDDQLHREVSRGSLGSSADDVDMDASQELVPRISMMKANELSNAALEYGQELQKEFGTTKQLREIFGIMAYTNIAGNPLSHLFDPEGRALIAEEVNGAILISLGKPSSAALEKLCAQTEALLDETASKTGGAASFINVRKDFVQD